MTIEGKKYLKLWCIAALTLGVLRLLGGCTRYVQVEAPPKEIVVELEPWSSCAYGQMCQIGQVVCSNKNQPVIVLRRNIPAEQLAYTLIHERVHTTQMQGNCEAVRQRYRSDPNVQWQMELEAYCAEAEARIKAGMPMKGVMAGLTTILNALYEATDEDIVCRWMQKPP